MNNAQVQTQEISDADLDNVSGGLGAVMGTVNSTVGSLAPATGTLHSTSGLVHQTTGQDVPGLGGNLTPGL